jgi:hypothetical protein
LGFFYESDDFLSFLPSFPSLEFHGIPRDLWIHRGTVVSLEAMGASAFKINDRKIFSH